MHHVIIGAGPAGIIAGETLRKLDPRSAITVIGDESEPPYSRMALPYFLTDKINEMGTYLRKGADYYAVKRIDVKIDKVIRVDPATKQVQLASGKEIPYDKLLIATGSHPRVPPNLPGIDLPGIYPCWTLEDARHIASQAMPGAKVVLMGAGFIGCIILEALAKRGVKLTIVEREDGMVPRMMNSTAGALIKQWCNRKGVTVHTSIEVTAIEEAQNGRRFNVVLGDGHVLPADLVITATGVGPNVQFLQGSGIRTEQGILIDRSMQTSYPDIYAAGDVAQGIDFSTGQYSVQAIQPTAAEHGQIAARNMAGLKGALHRGSINMNVLDTLGLISSSFGLWMGAKEGDSVELCHPERYRYINLQFQDDLLVGATALGLTQHVGVLRGLIQSKIRLKSWKDKLKADPTRIMEAYIANTHALGFNAEFYYENKT